MSTVAPKTSEAGPRVEWWARSGGRCNATLVRHPTSPGKEREIQVETDAGIPQRVLCLGPVNHRFPELSSDELELIRRAAEARSGILWLDPRDGELWWVDQEHQGPSGWTVVYSSARRERNVRPHPRIPVVFLRDRDHQRLLDGTWGREA
ncbi:MAG: hypothetical protein ACOC9H_00055 [Gemmatimonadota bacterium]